MRLTSRAVRPLLALVLATTVLIAAPAPASATTTSVSDPAGDGAKGPRLDITAAVLKNGDKGLKVRVNFVRVSKGDLVVFLKLRGHKGSFRAVSEYRPTQGTVKDHLLGGLNGNPVPQCAKLRTAWRTDMNKATMRIPASCLDRGNYGAVRFKVLTEIGPDADLAPESPTGRFMWSEYTPRG